MRSGQVEEAPDLAPSGSEPEISAFLSYERTCRAFVISFASDLERKRISIRGDWQLVPGEDWWDQITDQIVKSDNFLFLLTPESVKSPACLRELDPALAQRKKILPLVREKPSPQALAEMPEVLGKEQWVFIRPEDDPSTAIDGIVSAVRTDFELAIKHTRLTIWTNAWEKRAGDLLRGTYLQEAENAIDKMDARAPLLPSVTPQMRLFVEESRRAEKRRKRFIRLLTVVAIVILGLLSGIAWQKKRLADKQQALAESERKRAELQTKNAKLERLRRDGDSALASVRGGDVAGAIVLLENIVTNDPANELPTYRVIHRFLRPLLVPQSEAISNLLHPNVFRWRGGQFVLLNNEKFIQLTGPAIEIPATVSHGRYLMTADVAKSVCLYDLSQFSRIQCLSFPDDRVKAFYELPDTGSLAIVVSKLILGSDEDERTAEEVAGSYMALLRRPDAKPELIDVDHFASSACGKAKDQPCGFHPATVLGEGGIPTLLAFPRVRPETSYWRRLGADSSELPSGWKVSRIQSAKLSQARVNRINFSSAGIKPSDDLFLPRYFKIERDEYLTTEIVVGNQ